MLPGAAMEMGFPGAGSLGGVAPPARSRFLVRNTVDTKGRIARVRASPGARKHLSHRFDIETLQEIKTHGNQKEGR
jgi:hypothetical protein